jgi:hypothetical protein
MIQTADSLHSIVAQNFRMYGGVIAAHGSNENEFYSLAVPENSLLRFAASDGTLAPTPVRVYCEEVSFDKAWFHGYLVLIYVSLELVHSTS